jgi:hypothetical protein
MSNIKLTKAEDVATGYKERMKEIESEIKAIVEEASIGDPTKN